MLIEFSQLSQFILSIFCCCCCFSSFGNGFTRSIEVNRAVYSLHAKRITFSNLFILLVFFFLFLLFFLHCSDVMFVHGLILR